MTTAPFEPGTEPFPDPDAPAIPDPMTDPIDPDVVPPEPGAPTPAEPETQPEPV
ncbi:hypothetical protein [Nocardioides sp. Iso805N]|jgi:hypothetical protein|uniref:hypothetical protein n=1 Tax=Nocardioides sp. Iso805N TaxID=1283287 RepID=UPI000369D1A2|nr:hypothetical protein [Nocardioides sp. Iso805N]